MRYTPDILQRASAAIYLAAPKEVADQIAAMLRQAAEDCRDAERWRFREKLLNDGGQIWQTLGKFSIRDFKRDVIARGESEVAAIDAAINARQKSDTNPKEKAAD